MEKSSESDKTTNRKNLSNEELCNLIRKTRERANFYLSEVETRAKVYEEVGIKGKTGEYDTYSSSIRNRVKDDFEKIPQKQTPNIREEFIKITEENQKLKEKIAVLENANYGLSVKHNKTEQQLDEHKQLIKEKYCAGHDSESEWIKLGFDRLYHLEPSVDCKHCKFYEECKAKYSKILALKPKPKRESFFH